MAERKNPNKADESEDRKAKQPKSRPAANGEAAKPTQPRGSSKG